SLAVLLFVAATARAQAPANDPALFAGPTPLVPAAAPRGSWLPGATLQLDLRHNPLIAVDPVTRAAVGTLVAERFETRLVGAFAFGERLELAFALPVSPIVSGTTIEGLAPPASGLGDLTGAALVSLYRGTAFQWGLALSGTL